MTASNPIESLALFGSVPRGDHDSQSDRDILVVSSCNRAQISNHFSKKGYSPSVYSLPQLKNLAVEGSLFIQHLKQEGKLLLDRGGCLQKILDSFLPKDDYNGRLEENRLLFGITKGVPNNKACINWAFDVLAVAFRNHAILHFAQSGIYEFSFDTLVRKFASEFGLSPIEIALLRDLRKFKHQYRIHPHMGQGNLLALQRTQALMKKIVLTDCYSEELQPADFIASLSTNWSEDLHWYLRLRKYEGIYRAMGYTPMNDSSSSLTAIERLFSQPSPYNGAGDDSINWIRCEIQSLRFA